MKANAQVYRDMTKSIAPQVYGHDDVKRAVLLMLFGGVHKETKEVLVHLLEHSLTGPCGSLIQLCDQPFMQSVMHALVCAPEPPSIHQADTVCFSGYQLARRHQCSGCW